MYVKIISFVCLLIFVVESNSLMLRKDCHHDEVHRSCYFYEEYTCWETESLSTRVKSSPKRLAHCRSGCFCKKGMVRAYPSGNCIIAMSCRDLQLQEILMKVPDESSNF